jgi:hypothetical protein
MTDRWSYQPGSDPRSDRTVKRPVTVKALAEALGVRSFQVIKDLIRFKVFAKNDSLVLEDAHATAIAKDYKIDLVIED